MRYVKCLIASVKFSNFSGEFIGDWGAFGANYRWVWRCTQCLREICTRDNYSNYALPCVVGIRIKSSRVISGKRRTNVYKVDVMNDPRAPNVGSFSPRCGCSDIYLFIYAIMRIRSCCTQVRRNFMHDASSKPVYNGKIARGLEKCVQQLVTIIVIWIISFLQNRKSIDAL